MNNYALQLHSNVRYWQAVWRDEHGRRHKRSLGAKRRLSRLEALSACVRLAGQLRLEEAGGLPRIDELYSTVIANRPGLKPATRQLMARSLDLLCRWADETLSMKREARIDTVTRQAATDFHGWLHTRSETSERRMLETTIVSHLRRCRTAWNLVIEPLEETAKGLVSNPWARRGWRMPKVAQDWTEVTLPMLERLLEACPHEGVRTMLALCRLAGLRAGEARRLRVCDVDLPRRTLTILPELVGGRGGSRVEGTKQRARVVPIRPALAKILAKAIKAKAPPDLICPQVPNKHNLRRYLLGGEVGPNKGKPRPRYVGVIERAGLTPWGKPLHTLRRCCGTEWAEEGIPITDVAKWMGNSVAVAADYYVRTTPHTFARITGQPQTLPQTRKASTRRPRVGTGK